MNLHLGGIEPCAESNGTWPAPIRSSIRPSCRSPGGLSTAGDWLMLVLFCLRHLQPGGHGTVHSLRARGGRGPAGAAAEID